MQRVSTRKVIFEDYMGIVPNDLLAEAVGTARRLNGLRIAHINATPEGGGVAEILKTLVPLMQSVGLKTEWYATEPEESFFRVTKALHHCLQGANDCPSADEIGLYLSHNKKAADAIAAAGITADLWIIHDVQVLPLLHYLKTTSPAIWVCHIDTTKPNEMVREMLLPYINEYQRVLFSMPEYFLEGVDAAKVSVFQPAIDPLTSKNLPMPGCQAREALAKLGIDPERPLVSQVSRFDRWKDPWGVISAYRLAKHEIPDIQLALVGVMTAQDDPDAVEVFTSVRDYAAGDPDIYLFSDPLLVGDKEVNAFQSGADIIIQKSTQEGFGLTVTEAMWKGTPVIGGDCGGIHRQICDGENGFLVSDVPSCAEKIVALLKDRQMARRMGEAGRASVTKNYLMPRLLKDYLELALILADSSQMALANV